MQKPSVRTTATIVLAGGLVGACASGTSAQTVWDGEGSDNNWSTPQNWHAPMLGDVEPGENDDAVLNNGDTILINQAGEMVRDFMIGSETGGTGTLQMSDGDLSASLVDIGRADGGSGTLLMEGGEISTRFRLFRFGVDDGSNGTLNMTGGTINVDTDDVDLFLLGDNGDSIGNTISGGTINTDVFGVAFQGSSTADLTISDTADINANHVELGLRGGTASVVQSGGAVNSANIVLIGEGGNASYTITGGTVAAGESIEVGRFSESAVFTQGGDSSATSAGREFFGDFAGLIVGDSGTGTYNLGDSATFSTEGTVIVGAFPVGTGDINQSGSSIFEADGMILGKRGTGSYAQTGGTANFANNIFLGDFDNTLGTYEISGGALNVGGNLNVGAALASNAPESPEEPDGTNGPQGQALNVSGVFNVQGSAATIAVGGDLLANPADKGDARSGEGQDNHATLIFDLDSGGVSTIFVDGVADLDGAVIDINDEAGYFAANESVTLIDAAGGLANGGAGWVLTQGDGEGFMLAEEDQALYNLDVLSNGSGGEMLVATLIPEPTAMVGLLGGVGLLLRRRRN